jgi:hypothetical protein
LKEVEKQKYENEEDGKEGKETHGGEEYRRGKRYLLTISDDVICALWM